MATITPKIGLKKPELTDTAGQTIADLQANFDKIDDLAAQPGSYTSGVSSFTPTSVKAALDALAGVRIVEMGSNANGAYVRWENGLQLCWHRVGGDSNPSNQVGSLHKGQGRTWTYPATFVSPPTVAGAFERSTEDYVGFIGWHTTGTASAVFCVVASSSWSSLTIVGHLVAIGRWK